MELIRQYLLNISSAPDTVLGTRNTVDEKEYKFLVITEFIFSRSSLDLIGSLLKHFGEFVIKYAGEFNFSGFQDTLKHHFHLLNEFQMACYLSLGYLALR